MDRNKDIIDSLNVKKKFPAFRVGDTVRVHVRILEGEKERIQVFEGVVIKRRRGGVGASFTVRKLSYGIGVERVFPFQSPIIEKIEVLQQGKVRRARLFYLRKRRGKDAQIQENDRIRDTGEPEAESEESMSDRGSDAANAQNSDVTTSAAS